MIVAAMGSSVFAIFMTPNSRMAAMRRVVGGHLAAALVGSLAALGLQVGFPGSDAAGSQILHNAITGLAAGVSILALALTDTEHAPAAGTALGLPWGPFTLVAVASIAVGAMLLALARIVLRHWLRDLL